jgi:hypothetical protein
MKSKSIVLLLAAVSLLTPIQAGQTPSTKKESPAAKSPPPSATVNNNYEATKNPDKDEDKSHWYAGPEWWLVIGAFLGLGFVAWQAFETRRAVESANKNIEVMIGKERARLQIIAGNVSVAPGEPIGIRCYLNNIGPTTAFIENGGVILLEGPDEIDVDYSKCGQIPNMGSVPGVSRTPTEFLLALRPDLYITESKVLQIRERKAFIHCYGFVNYRDVFERSRRVQLHLRWFMQFGGVVQGQITEYWELVGDAEENSDK